MTACQLSTTKPLVVKDKVHVLYNNGMPEIHRFTEVCRWVELKSCMSGLNELVYIPSA